VGWLENKLLEVPADNWGAAEDFIPVVRFANGEGFGGAAAEFCVEKPRPAKASLSSPKAGGGCCIASCTGAPKVGLVGLCGFG